MAASTRSMRSRGRLPTRRWRRDLSTVRIYAKLTIEGSLRPLSPFFTGTVTGEILIVEAIAAMIVVPAYWFPASS
jgi:hypothetical protein